MEPFVEAVRIGCLSELVRRARARPSQLALKRKNAPRDTGLVGLLVVPLGLPPYESPQLTQENCKRRLTLQHDVIAAFQWNETGSRNARGQPPARFEGNSGIVPGMHHQRRRLDLWQKRCHVDFTVSDQIAYRVGRRCRNSLQLVEPIGLLLGSAGDKLRSKHLPKRGIFLSPP